MHVFFWKYCVHFLGHFFKTKEKKISNYDNIQKENFRLILFFSKKSFFFKKNFLSEKIDKKNMGMGG